MVTINPLVREIKPSATLMMNQKVAGMRAAGKTVYHLGFGQSPFPVPELVAHALAEHKYANKYLPTAGLWELREIIGQQQGCQPEQVFIGPGSKELIMQLLFLLHGPILLPTPSWVSYASQAKLLNKTIIDIPTKFTDNYCLHAEALAKACLALTKKQQKILILNSPNNPTGAVYSTDNLRELATVCREQNIVVISDEIYQGIEFHNQGQPSIRAYYPEKTMVTNGISKHFSAGGYRLGYCIVPANLPELHRDFDALISGTFSAVCSPVQYAAYIGYRDREALELYFSQCVALHKLAAFYIFDQLTQLGVNCPPPQGALYLFPNFNAQKALLDKLKIHTSAELAHYLLDKHHLATLPGSDFGMPATDFSLRLAHVDYDGREALNLKVNGASASEILEQGMPNLVAACAEFQRMIRSQ